MSQEQIGARSVPYPGSGLDAAVVPTFTAEPGAMPSLMLPEHELAPEVAHQLVHDELMLDGNARLNLATFVTTWMEPHAAALMAECADKNMIDKDEYPRTAELERRCSRMLADLWHAPDPSTAPGCSTAGSSEACMLAGLALKRRWTARVGTGSGRRPNIVMGADVQVCWDKFANYFEVEARVVPMQGGRFHLDAEQALARVDEDTIGVVAVLGSTFDGSYEPVAEICAALDGLAERGGPDVAVHVDGASGAMIAPFLDPDLVWDFRLPRVASINTSGHKYGLVYPGLGWVAWRDTAALPEDLIYRVNYLGDELATFTLNFSRSPRSTTSSCVWAATVTPASSSTAATSPPVSPSSSRPSARSGCSRVATSSRSSPPPSTPRSPTTRSSTSRPVCASTAGRSPPMRSRPSVRTSRSCGS
jgi:glutamate decarboxylase